MQCFFNSLDINSVKDVVLGSRMRSASGPAMDNLEMWASVGLGKVRLKETL